MSYFDRMRKMNPNHDEKGKFSDGPSEKRRDLHFAGYDFTSGPSGTQIQREYIDTKPEGDHGADLVGDGTFKMIPSGDIVSFEERNKRLAKYTKR
jgi:hypothetical protein